VHLSGCIICKCPKSLVGTNNAVTRAAKQWVVKNEVWSTHRLINNEQFPSLYSQVRKENWRRTLERHPRMGWDQAGISLMRSNAHEEKKKSRQLRKLIAAPFRCSEALRCLLEVLSNMHNLVTGLSPVCSPRSSKFAFGICERTPPVLDSLCSV
jgi:hypothetical protein